MSTSKRSKKTPEVSTTKAYYEMYAEEWSKTHANSFFHEKEFRVFRKLLRENASVVDIGCAAGVLVPLFCGIGKGLRYHGIDITKKFIDIASKRYPQLPFTQADITDGESLPKKKFDAFLLTAVLMHVPLSKWDETLTNIESILKPKSYGYIVLPSTRPETKLPHEDPRHFTILPKREHLNIMHARGWKILKTYTNINPRNNTEWNGYIVQLP